MRGVLATLHPPVHDVCPACFDRAVEGVWNNPRSDTDRRSPTTSPTQPLTPTPIDAVPTPLPNGAVRVGAQVLLAIMAPRLATYVSKFAAAKSLGPADLGTLSVLLSLLSLIGLPLGAVQVAVARQVAVLRRPVVGTRRRAPRAPSSSPPCGPPSDSAPPTAPGSRGSCRRSGSTCLLPVPAKPVRPGDTRPVTRSQPTRER